jgi:hypothetical protein
VFSAALGQLPPIAYPSMSCDFITARISNARKTLFLIAFATPTQLTVFARYIENDRQIPMYFKKKKLENIGLVNTGKFDLSGALLCAVRMSRIHRFNNYFQRKINRWMPLSAVGKGRSAG